MKAVIAAKDLGSIFSAAEMMWQFLLLGFVMGGVIFAIPTNDFNRDYFKLAGSFSVLGSIILVATIGFGIAAKDSAIGSSVAMVVSQIGLALVYAGIAMTAIELMKEICRFAQKSFYERNAN